MQGKISLPVLRRVLLACALSAAGAAHAVDIGVLAGSGGCAAGSESLYIWIDNEDYNNANSSRGWLGSSVVTENTELRFCRVNGDQFSQVRVNEPYMVLRLGNVCPSGASAVVLRKVDAENTSDGPESSSNIPEVFIDDPGSRPSNVLLSFCVFQPPANEGILFPDLGMEYGVFASPTFDRALANGNIYMDDEDGTNYDEWCDSVSGTLQCHGWTVDRDYWNVMGGGRNTSMNIARVGNAPGQGCSAVPAGASSLSTVGLALLTLMSLPRRKSGHRASRVSSPSRPPLERLPPP